MFSSCCVKDFLLLCKPNPLSGLGIFNLTGELGNDIQLLIDQAYGVFEELKIEFLSLTWNADY